MGFLCFPPSGEVISSVNELQSLRVEASTEEKRRSEAKHILMQKQRALSDLFKHLANTGKVPLGRKPLWIFRGIVDAVEI